MVKKTSTLYKLLEVLVQDHGYSQVMINLRLLQPDNVIENTLNSQSRSNKSKKISGVSIVEKMDIKDDLKRIIMLKMAEKFDQKLFLPSMGGVKNFLNSHGHHGPIPKSRDASTKLIFELLNAHSKLDLEILARNETYSGPSELQSLSDAIRTTGAVIREE